MMRKKRVMLLSVVSMLCLGAAQVARAADVTPQPCHDDVQKFCAKVKPGKGRIAKCLMDHDADLSQACKSDLQAKREQMLERMQEVREACGDDAKKFCKDVQPGHGRIAACLKQHDSELSAACKKEMKK